jgi:hypothetical protein
VETGAARFRLSGTGGVHPLAFSEAAHLLAVCAYGRDVSLFGLTFRAPAAKALVREYEPDQEQVPSAGWRRYFLDGVHPLYGLEVVFSCWLLAGQRFEVGVDGGRKRLNILGVYCPDDQEYLDRRYTDQNLNAQSVIALFTLMMDKHPQTRYFRIYLDNARYQHATLPKEWVAQTQQGAGVTFDLKYLPAYSPDLNLIERLRKFLRKEALQRWHATFEVMQQAVAEVLDTCRGITSNWQR